jgi:hypothetical protein
VAAAEAAEAAELPAAQEVAAAKAAAEAAEAAAAAAAVAAAAQKAARAGGEGGSPVPGRSPSGVSSTTKMCCRRGGRCLAAGGAAITPHPAWFAIRSPPRWATADGGRGGRGALAHLVVGFGRMVVSEAVPIILVDLV